jgi:predicted nucleic acid-binding protein
MPPNPTVYIETSVVSYLTAWPSRDLVLAAHQQVTRDWWETRDRFDLYTSQFALDEAAAGDEIAAASRLAVLEELRLLEVTEEAVFLAERLLSGGGVPPKARLDALHVAMAAAHGMDYLLTWNCKHIANASLRGQIEEACRASGMEPPIICTPLELVREEST